VGNECKGRNRCHPHACGPGEGIFPDAESSRRRQTGIRPDTEPEQYVVSDNAETKRGAARKKSEKEGALESLLKKSSIFLISQHCISSRLSRDIYPSIRIEISLMM